VTVLCFVDTETTSLRPNRRAWEVAIIRRGPNGGQTEHCWLIKAEDLKLDQADPASLKIGRFYERHPQTDQVRSASERWDELNIWTEWSVAQDVERLTRGAHIVGAVPNFDTEVLAAMLRRNGLCPAWHYHLIDVENLVAGRLGIPPPWSSDDLTKALGVEPPGDDERHTALGDARWAMRTYDAIMR
jgi:hypothetical protein